MHRLYISLTRPSFEKLLAAFPTDQNGNPLSAEEVYRLIGGKVLAAHENNPDAFRNACTLRMSRALIYAGIKIPYIKGATLTGADGYNYIFRASDMYKWLSKPSVFGAPDISTSNIAQIKGMQGIYIMQAHYPAYFGAWGHVTLFDGYNLLTMAMSENLLTNTIYGNFKNRTKMKYLFLFFASLLTILTLQYNQNISTNKHDNREMLRDYFLYACINHEFKEFHLAEKDHSGAVYLELLKYDLEALNKVDSLAKTFVQTIPISNYENRKTKGIIILSIKEYNSKRVKSFIKSMDKYMLN